MWDNYWAFCIFVMVMTSTPGPGNLALLAVGQTAGFRGALPLLLGCMSAMFCLNVAVAFGLGGIIAGSPGLSRVLQVAGMGYMVYLGAKILRLQLKETLEPMRFSFVEGFLIHPFSPKSWAMSVVGYTQLAEPDASVVLQASVFAGTFLLQQAVFHSMWALAGARLVGLLRQGRMLRAVTATCVVLMLTSTAWAMFA